MIVEGIPFGTVGEAFRFSVAGYLRASIRITADSASAGTIHIRRAWGSNIVAAYSPAQTIQVNGSEPVDLVVDDCSELVVWVTAAGSGTFDLEYTLDTPAIDALSVVYATMGRKGRLWSDLLSNERLDRITVVAELDDADTTSAIELRAAVDPDGEATTIGSIALDGTPTSFTLGARTRVDLYCTGPQADQGVELRVYRVQSPQMMGVDELELPDTLAYTDQAQQWAFLQQFDNFNITGSGSGRTRITSSATAGEVVDLPALSGGIPILTDLVPAANEFMVRQGSGGYQSRVLAWSDIASAYAGSSFPGSPSDGQPFYRTDLDIPELFHYDATRGKWLGELRTLQFNRGSAASSGTLELQIGTVQCTSGRGMLTPAALTIVGAEFFNAGSFAGTAELNVYEGGTNLATLLTINDRGEHDHTLNIDLDADEGWPHKYPQINNISGGTINNPIVTIFFRRRES